MTDLIFGYNSALEAIRAKLPIEQIWLARDLPANKAAPIIELARKQGITIERCSREMLATHARSPRTQGVLVFIGTAESVTIGDILSESERRGEAPLVALLDQIEDPHNLGAILRAADGAGVHGVVLPKRRSAGLTATVARTSAGAFAHVKVVSVSNLGYTIDDLKKKNIWVACAEQHARQTIYEADLSGALAIVIGAEGKGVRPLIRKKCDFHVRIPMYGQLNSLNASVAAALMFFEARRQRQAVSR